MRTLFSVSRGHRRHRHADRLRVGRPHDRLRALRHLRRRGPRPAGGRAGADQAAARPRPRASMPVVIGPRAAAGCSSTRRAATASRPTSSPRARRCSAGRVGELVASPLITLVDDGTMAAEWGCYAVDDEGRPPSATSSSRTACSPTTCGTSCGPARRAARRATAGAGDLPAPADGADDQHLPRSPARTTPTTSSPAPTTACTSPSSAAAR